MKALLGLWSGGLLLLTLISPVPVLANSELMREVPLNSANNSPRSFTLTYGSQRWTASANEVATWYKTRSHSGQQLMQLRPGAIYNYLNVHISPTVNQLGRSSRFAFVGQDLHLVGPGSKGQIVDGVKTSLAIRSALASGQATSTVSLKEHRPSVFSASDFTKLSFPTLLAQGESNFAGSPANRVHNIRVAADKYHGLVIMPGEEFSFNQHLGSVDAANGYLPELVIKDNVTTPEYGGGICQVSTTAFRAALQAGLKITARKNHSYPVAYYGTPGYDATVYSPHTDLKFVNDTPHPLYLTTKITGSQLQFSFWGISDGREVKVNGPFVTKKFPNGSLEAAIAQIVTKNGRSLREQNFVSLYQSPDKFPTVRTANGER
jgi:vancomycin resistance protein YoaR